MIHLNIPYLVVSLAHSQAIFGRLRYRLSGMAGSLIPGTLNTYRYIPVGTGSCFVGCKGCHFFFFRNGWLHRHSVRIPVVNDYPVLLLSKGSENTSTGTLASTFETSRLTIADSLEKIVFFITLHAQIMINCCDYQAELLHSFEGEQSDYLL